MEDETTRQQILEAERRRCAALESGDIAGLADLLSPGYRHIHGTGQVESRDEYLSRLGTGGYRRIERSELEVELYGAVATMSGLSVTIAQPDPDAPRQRLAGRALQVWRHDDGGWRQAVFQMTLTGPPTEVAA